MYCNYCGHAMADAAIACPGCGRGVAAVASHAVPPRRILRPQQGRWIAGVCAAVANYFRLDVALIRIVWLLVALFGGGGIIAYIVAWILIPEEPQALPAPVQQARNP
jgi:phage shock protein C